jgi:uncharacterized protein DUF4388
MRDIDVTECDVVHLDDVETLDSLSSRSLVELAREGVTGELVCSCRHGEAHLYLQRGRVAWANDCKHHRAFTGHLKEHARIDTATIEGVVAECRATKRPIGETLVRRRLATEEQVRAALRHQIALALHIGDCPGDGGSAFLPRDYDEYDVRFTFDAAELVAGQPGGAAAPAPGAG